ncbi:hypothetical protein [Klebsiella michiganensis]|nr:hypothetical protein [Klebsiella michiganensis]
MKLLNVAIIVGTSNSISAFGCIDGRDMFTKSITITKEKCLAPMVDFGNPGEPLPSETITTREYTHTDGNIYLVGVRPGGTQSIDFESVINFAKGDKSLPYRWL